MKLLWRPLGKARSQGGEPTRLAVSSTCHSGLSLFSLIALVQAESCHFIAENSCKAGCGQKDCSIGYDYSCPVGQKKTEGYCAKDSGSCWDDKATYFTYGCNAKYYCVNLNGLKHAHCQSSHY